MKGYKAFKKDLTCRGFQFEIGKEYEHKGKIEPCESGFHFCESLADCYNFYPMSEDTRICEISATGDIKTDDNIKFVTNKIKIVREIKNPREKSNKNKTSTGCCNTGNYNTGDCNTGNYNTGVFCTNENPKINMFDDPSEWTMQDWLRSDAREILSGLPYTHTTLVVSGDMSEEEKENHPEYKTIGGYLKTIIATADGKQAWWDNLTDAEKNIIKTLPNFDEIKFCKCIGIKRI